MSRHMNHCIAPETMLAHALKSKAHSSVSLLLSIVYGFTVRCNPLRQTRSGTAMKCRVAAVAVLRCRTGTVCWNRTIEYPGWFRRNLFAETLMTKSCPCHGDSQPITMTHWHTADHFPPACCRRLRNTGSATSSSEGSRKMRRTSAAY